MRTLRKRMKTGIIGVAAAGVGYLLGITQDPGGFPSGYDAIESAPRSHRVILDNPLVRVLEVSVPSSSLARFFR